MIHLRDRNLRDRNLRDRNLRDRMCCVSIILSILSIGFSDREGIQSESRFAECFNECFKA